MSIPKWTRFIQQCLLKRISGVEFQELSHLMIESYQVPGKRIIHLLLQSRQSFCPTKDPLIPLYIHAIIVLGLAQISDVLHLLIQSWNRLEYRNSEEKQPGAVSCADAAIILDMSVTIGSHNNRASHASTRDSLSLSSRWLSALIKWVSQQPLQTTVHPVVTLIEAVGTFLVATASSDRGMMVLAEKKNIGRF